MSAWSFYSVATGLFTGRVVSCGLEALEANTPQDTKAVEGRLDHLSQRVDLATGDVVDYQPPAPADTAMQTWTWSEDVKRWKAVPTIAAAAGAARSDRDRRLAACDWLVWRAAETGQPMPEAWRTYRSALRDVPTQAGFPSAIDWPASPVTS